MNAFATHAAGRGMRSAEDRASPRLVANSAPVAVSTGGTMMAVQLADLSPEGCRIRTPARLTLGAFVTFEVECDAICGWVAWSHNNWAGICFASPLPSARHSAWIGDSQKNKG